MGPVIEDYFVTRVIDIPTGNIVKNTSGMLRSAQLIEGFLVGLAFTFLATFTPLLPEMDILIGFVTVVLGFISLEITAQRSFNKAIMKAENDMKFKPKSGAK